MKKLAMRALSITLLVVLIVAIRSVVAQADEVIQKGQTKSYWVAPAGSLKVYYYSIGSPSILDAWITGWYWWLDEQPPQGSVDIYAAKSLSDSTWYWLYRINLKPWQQSSPPLLLTNAVYKFEIRVSAIALITLKVR